MNVPVSVMAAALLLLPGCGPSSQQQAPTASQVDTKPVRDASDARSAALASGDIEGYLGLHADDAVWMPPNAPDIIGKDVGRQRLQQVFAEMTIEQKVETDELTMMSPEWVSQRGQYSVVSTPKKGGTGHQDVGSFLTIWRLGKDGKWQVAFDIWKSNRPPQEPEGKK
jgi:uncharacterized protein (TIGR02246 family)